jgi:thioredoxin reductase (NADPH)
MAEEYDIIVVGAGVAGLSAAMYSARLGMRCLVLGSSFGSETPIGGTVTTTKVIENWPGDVRINGMDLAEKIKKHAESYELVSIKEERVLQVKKKKEGFLVKSSKEEYLGKTVLFATGTVYKKLNVPGAKEFENKGVFYCALCDAPLFKNKNVAVVGGADSGVKGALLLSEYAKKVYVIEALEKISPEKTNGDRILANKKIEIVTGTKVTKIDGKGVVQFIEIDKPYKKETKLEVDGVLIAIGRETLSGLAKILGVELNGSGEIVINHKTCETNVGGVYAAGDVVDGSFKQAITGSAEGCTAAYSASEYVKKNFQ